MENFRDPPSDHERLPTTLTIGVTGHREGNPDYDANRQAIANQLSALFEAIDKELGAETSLSDHSTRLVTNLAHGTDVVAAEIALEKGWPVSAPLPFGRDLNVALNTPGLDLAEMLALAQGTAPSSQHARDSVDAMRALYARVSCFELADQDHITHEALRKAAEHPGDTRATQNFTLHVTSQARVASIITVQQADILIAVWDGLSPSAAGGTRDTIEKALGAEVPVVWIDARNPAKIYSLLNPTDLASDLSARASDLLPDVTQAIVQSIVAEHGDLSCAEQQLNHSNWRPRSRRRYHAYRRIEAVFGGTRGALGSLVQTYERFDEIAEGSAAANIATLKDLPGADTAYVGEIARHILPRFAIADGLATYFSDAYRGGMAASFLFSAAAVIVGISYLPVVPVEYKWPFALLEFILLCAIVFITVVGTRGNWHRRWFRLRRVAEYLRFAPIMLVMGTMRPAGRWPKSRDEHWPEISARALMKAQGLPHAVISQAYLRDYLRFVLQPYMVSQSNYHREKALKLERIHANLDRCSNILFQLAIVAVGGYLLMKLGASLQVLDEDIPLRSSKWLTFLGVAFPTLGAALAGIRYFGDFERFAAISDVTRAKLLRLEARADILLDGDAHWISYEHVADITQAMSDIVVEEIESWQSIFGTKKMSVPV
jgi:hypothetical protein